MFAHERAEDPSVILPVAPASSEHDFVRFCTVAGVMKLTFS